MSRLLTYTHVLTSDEMVAGLKKLTDAWEERPGLPDIALTLFYVSAADLCLATSSPGKKTLKEIHDLWKQFEKSGGQKTQVMQIVKTQLSQMEKQARQQSKAATATAAAAEPKPKSEKATKKALKSKWVQFVLCKQLVVQYNEVWAGTDSWIAAATDAGADLIPWWLMTWPRLRLNHMNYTLFIYNKINN